GLFENGIVFWSAELRQGSFVPYGLIRDFEVTRVLRTETLMLEIEGFEDKAPMMAAKVLGDDGLEMLRKIIDMRHDYVGPPDLHVYGGRSSKVSTMAGRTGDVEEGA
ncbi:MAG: hypothetical protein JSW25_06835, partial [Thermoplasmata archaeon]